MIREFHCIGSNGNSLLTKPIGDGECVGVNRKKIGQYKRIG